MILLWLLAHSATQAAAVQVRRFEDVQIGSVVLRVPFPRGYCKPTGTDAATFQVLAASDHRNVTLLSLIECDQHSTGRSYILFKTPVAALNAELDRDVTLRELAAEAEVLPMSTVLDAAGEVKSEASGESTKVDGDFGPRGRDDVCVYMGGLLRTASGTETQAQALGTCITVAGKRLIVLNAYEDSADPAAYKAILPKTRNWVLGIVARP